MRPRLLASQRVRSASAPGHTHARALQKHVQAAHSWLSRLSWPSSEGIVPLSELLWRSLRPRAHVHLHGEARAEVLGNQLAAWAH